MIERKGKWGAVLNFDSLMGYGYWLSDAEANEAEEEGRIRPYWKIRSIGASEQIRKRRLQRQFVIQHCETGEERIVTCGKNLRYSR